MKQAERPGFAALFWITAHRCEPDGPIEEIGD